jgi:hypothetical protein
LGDHANHTPAGTDVLGSAPRVSWRHAPCPDPTGDPGSIAAIGVPPIVSAQSGTSQVAPLAREFFIYGWNAPKIDAAETRIKAEGWPLPPRRP